MIYQGKARYPVTEAILHTSATSGDWWKGKTVEDMRDEIRRWHVDGNKWSDIGYHRVIAPDGSMATGRSLWTIGAHVAGHNAGSIGICLIPVVTITKMGKVEDYYTPQQVSALKSYLLELSNLTKIKKVTGHNQYANKLCPGFIVNTKDWL